MSERLRKTLGAVQTILLIGLVVGGLTWAAIVGVPHVSSSHKVKKAVVVHDAIFYTASLGLRADALAAVGVTGNQAATVIADLRGYWANHGSAVVEANSDFQAAQQAADTALRQVRAGKAEAELLTTKHAAFTAAQATRKSLFDAAFAAAVDSLSEQQRTAILRIEANRKWAVPAQYLIVDRTESEWVTLRDALSQKKQRAHYNLEPETAAAAVIATADADSAVSSASTQLSANLAGVKSSMTAPPP